MTLRDRFDGELQATSLQMNSNFATASEGEDSKAMRM